jgi:YfiH family protein
VVFSSLLFIFLFFAVVLTVYYCLPKKFRNGFLFVANLVFYGYGEPIFVLLMLFSVALNYASGLLLGKFADCVPILLADRRSGACAVVHAGWRGTVADIAAKGARALCACADTAPADLIAAIGPSIGPCCFLTHDDVADPVRALCGASAADHIAPAADGRWHIDLKGINAARLEAFGVGEIHVCTECTCCLPERYYSHRRTGLARGSLAAVIQRN